MDWMCGFIKENGNLTINAPNSTLGLSKANGSVEDIGVRRSNMTSEDDVITLQTEFISFCNTIIMPTLCLFGIFGNFLNLIILTKKVGDFLPVFVYAP